MLTARRMPLWNPPARPRALSAHWRLPLMISLISAETPLCGAVGGGVPGRSILVRASRPAWIEAASIPGTCGLPLGAAGPAAGPVPGEAPGRLVRFPKMDPKIPPSPPCPAPPGPGAADGDCPGPTGLRPPPNIWPRMEPRAPPCPPAGPGAGGGCCGLPETCPPPNIWPSTGPRSPCLAALASCPRIPPNP